MGRALFLSGQSSSSWAWWLWRYCFRVKPPRGRPSSGSWACCSRFLLPWCLSGEQLLRIGCRPALSALGECCFVGADKSKALARVLTAVHQNYQCYWRLAHVHQALAAIKTKACILRKLSSLRGALRFSPSSDVFHTTNMAAAAMPPPMQSVTRTRLPPRQSLGTTVSQDYCLTPVSI